jgi:hypothetical protein
VERAAEGPGAEIADPCATARNRAAENRVRHVWLLTSCAANAIRSRVL